ncbi:5'-methylthioadenosine/adenosylhomocysteine nucleosidase [Sedimentibacter hydroxybenzoicus DSM 7310]|uniref:adenosylhomocysteine nucleosidase n=1 Tax=Sedimentibacter hydroxybenzoicus DSM 7310 TaxID=1123245 RepID=A0A974BHJ7_SEDHY|nr:5'-methylthioadenosine/adenosylhomocysteine nucleosidase [Sedimentibacter hydroxybenzoicus]NYB73304.1 5'-methylthioadenosine/adenosylhomocysteine nucleosidase [Sedimentibacter hydroxybenzoicus DSM 7310]
MKIGILGAMEVEVQELIENMENIKEETISSITFYSGTLQGKNVIVARCGVGKVHSGICTQTMILKYAPDAIINTGVAGSLNADLDIADIVISDNVVQHDFDTSAFGDPMGLISGINLVKIPCPKELVQKIKEAADTIEGTNVVVGTIASGDQFICSGEKKDFIVGNFDALCAEMEGAAIGQVCYINNVDFCIVRAMSDKADGSAHMDFPTFTQIAAKKSTQLINEFLKCI